MLPQSTLTVMGSIIADMERGDHVCSLLSPLSLITRWRE